MPMTRLTPGKDLVGMVASLIISLAGGWLILAPFALGYQPSGADWASQTINDFVTGIAVAMVGLIGFVLFVVSLLGTLRAAGVLVARTQSEAQPQTTTSLVPAPAQSDLDRTLATLAAALAADLNTRREASGDQAVEHEMTRRVS